MELEFDISSFIVGDEFTGNIKELKQFIRSVMEASGSVQMVSNQTARIITLKVEKTQASKPVIIKEEATKTPLPNPFLTKEVKDESTTGNI